MRRKSISPELSAPGYLSILCGDPGTGNDLDLPFQYPIHDEGCGGASRLDTSGNDDICVENGESHLLFRR